MKRTIALICIALQALTGIAPAKLAINVFLLSGQSNMVGPGVPGELTPPYTTPLTTVTIKAGGDPTKGWGDLDPYYGASGTRFGPELVFSHDIVTNFTGEKVGLIKYSVGGRSLFGDYRPPSSGGTLGPLYLQLTNFVRTALNELNVNYDVRVLGMCWMQGESDAQNLAGANGYRTNLANFITDVRRDLGLGTMPFIIAMIDVQPAWTYNAIVRQAESDVAATVMNVAAFDTQGLATDGVHYTTPGLIALGHRFAQSMSAYLPDDSPGSWIVDANVNWNTAANWSLNAPASGSNVTANRFVTNDSPRTIGGLAFGDADTSSADSWNIVGSSTLTLQAFDAGDVGQRVAVGAGGHAAAVHVIQHGRRQFLDERHGAERRGIPHPRRDRHHAAVLELDPSDHRHVHRRRVQFHRHQCHWRHEVLPRGAALNETTNNLSA